MSPIPRRVAVALTLAILACLIGFILAIGSVRDRVDAQAAAESERLMGARLGDLQAALAVVTNDYNHWSDAHRAMAARDLTWIAENYAITATTGTMFDGLVLFDGPIGAPLGWQMGGPPEPGPSYLPPELLGRIRQEVAHLPLGERATFNALAAVDGRLILLSASHVQPLDPVEAAALDPASLAIAVTTNTFDAADAGQIVEALSLGGLHFVPADEPPRDAYLASAVLPLFDPDGAEIGVLTWNPPRPGSAVTRAMAPVLVGAGVVFVLLGAVAVALARAFLRRLLQDGAKAAQLARTDSLTGLPNRLAFNETLAASADAGRRAILFLDVNDFKRINDSIGHEAGDQVVICLARRLERLAGPETCLARIAGDEFVFVLTGSNVEVRTHRLTATIKEALTDSFSVLGHQMQVSLSMGYAVQATDDMTGQDLVRHADLAMYEAKRHKEEGRLVAFSAVIAQAARDAQVIEQELRRALAHPGELSIVYQPIVDGNGCLVRAEALARWTSPALGSVSPDRFIRVAEQAGLIVELGLQLFRLVCHDLAAHPELKVSVNISTLQLMAPDFVPSLLRELQTHSIVPARIEIELTEGVLVDDARLAARRIGELRAAGFSIALDDFGTGYSSMGYLDQLGFDTLKIDRSFVSRIRGADDGVAVMDGMIRMAHGLSLAVVCEGVETAEELDLLRKLGSDLAQGFHLDRPLPVQALASRWLHAHHAEGTVA